MLHKYVSLLAIASLHSIGALASPIDDLPILYGATGDNPKYREAASKAQQAVMIQLGVAPVIDKTISYVSNEADRATREAIDNYTPLNSEQVYFIIGTAYAIGIKREVSAKFHNPLFKQVNHTLTVGQHSQSFGLSLPF